MNLVVQNCKPLSIIMYRNEYNHVTATYFLLAERKLRAQRQDTARRARSVKRPQQGKPGFHSEVLYVKAVVTYFI